MSLSPSALNPRCAFENGTWTILTNSFSHICVTELTQYFTELIRITINLVPSVSFWWQLKFTICLFSILCTEIWIGDWWLVSAAPNGYNTNRDKVLVYFNHDNININVVLNTWYWICWYKYNSVIEIDTTTQSSCKFWQRVIQLPSFPKTPRVKLPSAHLCLKWEILLLYVPAWLS